MYRRINKKASLEFKRRGNMTVLNMNSKQINTTKRMNHSDWPSWLPVPSDEDIKMLAELSDRETGSAFFNNDERSDDNARGGTSNKGFRYKKR